MYVRLLTDPLCGLLTWADSYLIRPWSERSGSAFFTPPPIADFLARFAIRAPGDRVLDPNCGEAVFLLAAGERLKALKADSAAIPTQLTGVDLHAPSLRASGELLAEAGFGAQLVRSDFFALEPAPRRRSGWCTSSPGSR